MSSKYPGGLITKTPVVPSGPYETSTASGIWTLDQQAAYAKLGQWPTAGNPALDAQFNYVTMLLHGDGTNGAQNNTFLDSSSNTFSITRNGNTTQGSFSPYGSNWSNNLVSSATTYFVTPSSSSLALGTGDFTVEAWVNFSSLISGGRGIFQFSSSTSIPSNTNSLALGASSNGAVGWNLYANNNDLNSGVSVAIGTWYHVAVVRSSGTTKLYVNGTSVITETDSKDYTQTYLIIGGFYSTTFLMDGYISNFRVVKGTAVYTSSFTPSTTPLTAITNTSLLTCQSNRFKDNSTNNFTLTVNGTPSVQRFNPFGASTAYSTAVIGGSAYIDNNGYLGCGSQSAYALGTGDFTINAWIYPTIATNYTVILDTRGSGGSAGWALAMDGAKTIYFYSAVSFSVVVTSVVGAVNLNAWTYATVTRTSGTNRLYLNGVLVNTASNSDNYSHTALTCGYSAAGGGERYYGYMSDVQVIKGTAVAPTLPTAPVATSSGTSVLLNMQNGAIFDNAMMNNLETAGSAQISTSVVKYGTGSMLFDGTGDYLSILNTPVSTPSGTESWTIEGWVYRTTSGAFQAIYVNGYPIQIYLDIDTIEIYISSTNGFSYIVNGLTGPAASIALNTWTHFAVVRNGSIFTIYVNGVGGSTATSSTAIAFPSNANATIGDAPLFGAYGYTGYIDDFRITKGYARYTANFTPPTAAFFNTGPT